ncbi:laminin subunit alpha-3-like [Lycodopsis pacificus]
MQQRNATTQRNKATQQGNATTYRNNVPQQRTATRCSFGYYGNPMVHGGSCKEGLNVCDPLTGECSTSGNSSVHCHECDSCPVALLVDLEKMDDVLARLKQQLQNVTIGSVSLSRLNNLEANVSDTKILVGRHLDPEVEQLEADVDAVRDDFSQLTEKTLKTESDLEKFLQNVNGTTLQAEDLLSEAEALLTPRQDHITVRPRPRQTKTL